MRLFGSAVWVPSCRFGLGALLINWDDLVRGPKDHINMRISCPGSTAQNEGDTSNHGL